MIRGKGPIRAVDETTSRFSGQGKDVIASEAKQSFFLAKIASSLALLAMTGVHKLPAIARRGRGNQKDHCPYGLDGEGLGI
jgi:hypothetical protein